MSDIPPAPPIGPDYVRLQLARIEAEKGDYEAAHSMEDGLYATVLEAIANDLCDDPRECVRLALTSETIDFARYCA